MTSKPPKVCSAEDFEKVLLNQSKAGLTDVEKEIGTLFIRNTTVSVVRVLPLLEPNDQPLILWLIFVLLQRLLESLISDEI